MKKINISDNYSVSNDGKVFSHNVNRYMKPQVDKQGYQMVLISLGNRESKKGQLIHRLVAQAYIDNPDNKLQVNHKDGNKSNNNVDNLEWCTQSENMRHSIDVLGNTCGKPTSKGKFGYNHNRSVEVHMYDGDGLWYIKSFGSISEAAREANVGASTISEAIKNKNKTRKGRRYSKNKSAHFQIEPYN